MMTIQELIAQLKSFDDKAISLVLPDQSTVPPHFHITEVGYVTKHFIDCGGQRRQEHRCVLQIWVANDTEHRVRSEKFVDILALGEAVLPDEDLPVEFEYECPNFSQFALSRITADGDTLVLHLGQKHTDCLAKESCGIEVDEPSGCCSPASGCC